MTDGQTAVGMGGWIRVKIIDFETTLLKYSMCMAMIGFMLPPPTLYRCQYLFHQTPSGEVTHQFYKQLYTNIIRDIDNLQLNWKNGDYTLTCFECQSRKDKEGVLCLQYDDKKIVSGHMDNIIKIWDRKSLSVTTELQGHTKIVSCLQYDDRVVVTGSYDSTIRYNV